LTISLSPLRVKKILDTFRSSGDSIRNYFSARNPVR
jgi:hypothetical protein